MTLAAVTVLIVGGALFGLGLTRLVVAFPRFVAANRDGRGALASGVPLAAALRLALAGLALVALGLGWLFEAPAIVTLAWVFGLEELYETSAVLGLLRWGERNAWSNASAVALTPVSYPVICGAFSLPRGWM